MSEDDSIPDGDYIKMRSSVYGFRLSAIEGVLEDVESKALLSAESPVRNIIYHKYIVILRARCTVAR